MPAVGRRRTKDKHLPPRVYLRAGAFYFVDRAGKWHPLGKDYAEALHRYAAFAGPTGPGNTVADLVKRYTTQELLAKAERTRRGRAQEFKPILKAFGRMQPEQIEPHDVWGYWEARGKTEQARHEIRALSALLTYARRVGARTRPNPCFGLQLPASKRRSRYVTDREFVLVRASAQPMMRHAMNLALVAGIDGATVRRLEWRNVTDDGRGLTFERGKTKVLQHIVGEDVLAITKALRQERPQLRRFLICGRKGQQYTLNGFQSQWRRALERAVKAGLKETFHFHDLRAKSASDAASDKEAADRLGHGDEALTREVYRRLPREAEALSILDRLPKSAKEGE
jgi:integrase